MQGTPVSCEQLSLGIISSGTENPGYPGRFKMTLGRILRFVALLHRNTPVGRTIDL
jgi:hypothetical protein